MPRPVSPVSSGPGALHPAPRPQRQRVVDCALRGEEKVGASARVPVGYPVGKRLGSHVSRGRGSGCGCGCGCDSEGRGPRGPARGPCSAPGPPRAASSRAGALGPAEARAARQGPAAGSASSCRRGAWEKRWRAPGRGDPAGARRRERWAQPRSALPGFSYRQGQQRCWAAAPALPRPALAETPPPGRRGVPGVPAPSSRNRPDPGSTR